MLEASLCFLKFIRILMIILRFIKPTHDGIGIALNLLVAV